MRLGVALLLAAAVVGCSRDKATSPAEDDWIRVTSTEGRFSVLMPQQPTHEAQNGSTAAGEITLHIWTCKVSGTVAYSVLWNDMPEGTAEAFRSTPAKVLLDGGQRAAVGKDGSLVASRDFTFRGHSARELQFVKYGNAFLTMRMYWVDNRIYQTISVMPTNRMATNDILRFLDSFQLDEAN